MITEVAFDKVWIASSHADIHIAWVATGPVSDGDRVVAFTAKPTRSGTMSVQPQPGLHVALSSTDTKVDWNRSLDDMLKVLHHYIERAP